MKAHGAHFVMTRAEERCRDGLRPRVRLRGEGEGVTAFWESVRVIHGFAVRVGLEGALRRLVREGKLAEALVLAVQHDREVLEQCEAERREPEPAKGDLGAGGVVPVQTGESASVVHEWSRPNCPGVPPPEAAPIVKPSFDPRKMVTEHLPPPHVATEPPPRSWRDD